MCGTVCLILPGIVGGDSCQVNLLAAEEEEQDDSEGREDAEDDEEPGNAGQAKVWVPFPHFPHQETASQYPSAGPGDDDRAWRHTDRHNAAELNHCDGDNCWLYK